MTLTKARELLQLDLNDPGSVPIDDLNQAQALAIEVLGFTQAARLTMPKRIPPLFHEETEE